jgi:hypothetical protein
LKSAIGFSFGGVLMNRVKMIAAGLLLVLGGCSRSSEGPKPVSGKTFTMGSPAVAGLLTYTVVHSEWKETLEGESGNITPKYRFLVLDISIANAATEEANPPLLFAIGDKGGETIEAQNLRGMPGWLGIMRRIRPSETISGKVVFDVPTASYKLKVTSGGDPEKEVEAFIEVPLSLEGQGVPGAEAVPPAPGR